MAGNPIGKNILKVGSLDFMKGTGCLKFGFDTRKVQYSSLILTGQMTREEALDKLRYPAISDEESKHEFGGT